MHYKSVIPERNKELGEIIAETDEEFRFHYRGWKLWIPKIYLTKVVHGPYSAPKWAIEIAKDDPRAECENHNDVLRGYR